MLLNIYNLLEYLKKRILGNPSIAFVLGKRGFCLVITWTEGFVSTYLFDVTDLMSSYSHGPPPDYLVDVFNKKYKDFILERSKEE